MDNQGGKRTHKETSCFQTGLWADKRPKKASDGCGCEDNFGIVREDGGEESLLFLLFFLLPWTATLDPMAPRAERAFEDILLDELIAVPLASLSDSRVGSRPTNSFCSNCTTTYGRAYTLRTLRARACMSLTWI